LDRIYRENVALKDWEEHIDEWIAQAITGEISPENQSLLDEWLSLDEENRIYYRQMETLYQSDIQSIHLSELEILSAWEKVKPQLEGKGKGKGKGKEKGRVIPLKRRNMFLRIAAAITIIAVATFAIREYTKQEDIIYASANTVETKIIAGGSEVTLNKGSEISTAASVDVKERRVKLKGEAFFKVNEKDQAELIVQTEDLLIKDIGTSFNVKAIPGADTVFVSVSEGEVQLYTEDLTGISLLAGQSGYYVHSTHSFGKDIEVDENASSYVTKVFKFRNTSLRKAVKKLSEVYHQEIVIANSTLENYRISVNFENEELSEIMAIISETFGVQYRTDGEKYVIYGE
jgi:transmembrane sensor